MADLSESLGTEHLGLYRAELEATSARSLAEYLALLLGPEAAAAGAYLAARREGGSLESTASFARSADRTNKRLATGPG